MDADQDRMWQAMPCYLDRYYRLGSLQRQPRSSQQSARLDLRDSMSAILPLRAARKHPVQQVEEYHTEQEVLSQKIGTRREGKEREESVKELFDTT